MNIELDTLRALVLKKGMPLRSAIEEMEKSKGEPLARTNIERVKQEMQRR